MSRVVVGSAVRWLLLLLFCYCVLPGTAVVVVDDVRTFERGHVFFLFLYSSLSCVKSD